MDGIRLLAWLFSVVAHVTVAWLLLAQVVGSANEAGSGSDQFRIEQSVGIESVVTFGDATETTEAETAIPAAQAAQEQPEEVKEDTPSAIPTTAENPETTVAAQEVPPENEVKAKQQVAVETVQAEEVDQQAASASQSGGLATILSAYYSDMSRALERHKTKPAIRHAGVAVVRFSIEPSGRVISREIEKSSGSPMLDNAALASVDRASPLPPVPSEIVSSLPLTFSVPFNFIVR